VSRITEEQRASILALREQGLNTPDIAERLGLGKPAVRSIIAWLDHRDSWQKDAEDAAEVAQVADAIETTFGLERDLQRALRANIEQLEPGLKITDGGKEQTVDSGHIDITAEDANGATVVIELKAGSADRDAIGQVLSYIGDLTGPKKIVRGILIAGSFSLRAIAAARAVPNLELKRYAFKFSFESVHYGGWTIVDSEDPAAELGKIKPPLPSDT